MHRTPSFIPDNAPFDVCNHCLIALLDLRASSSCACCGAGEDAYMEDSIISAVKRLYSGEQIVPKYVCLMWSVGDWKTTDKLETHIGIFDTDDDPVEREPVEEKILKNNQSWSDAFFKMKKQAAQMSADG